MKLRREHPRRITFETLDQRQMLTANAELLLDINEGPDAALVDSATFFETFEFVEMNGHFYFAANDGIAGFELWKSDGTAGGTEMVADINQLPPEDIFSFADTQGSYPTGLVVFNDELYFAATDEDGDELWKTDGTADGTVQVKDIWEGPENSYPEGMYEFEDKLYFLASTEEEGGELWATDGTEAGTELVVDVYIGELNSNAQQFYGFNGELYFSAIATDDTTPELWKTDGTEAGTEFVKEINDFEGSYPEAFFQFNDELYFLAADGVLSNGVLDSHLYKTDGTEEGTVRVTNERLVVDTYAEPNLVEFNGYLYFGGIGPEGFELYRTDGTPGDSELVIDLQGAFPGAPIDLTVFEDSIYFAASDTTGRQVWRSNGEVGDANQTERLTSIVSGTTGMFPTEFVVAGNQMFLNGFDGEVFQVFQTTDGTTFEPATEFDPGTELDPNFFSDSLSWFFEFEGRLFFRGSGSPDTGLELWSVELTEDPEPELAGDVDGNGEVDFADFLVLSSNFGKNTDSRADGDLDGNGIVDFADFLILSADFGKSVDAAFTTDID